MKVALLAAGTSIHSIRWAEGLAAAGVEIALITQHPPERPLDPRVRVEVLPRRGGLGYLLNARPLRKVLRDIRPDLLNAHYASGYGTLARLSGFHPTLLSVWGSDVYDFTERSALHRRWLRGTLRWADAVASTSETMANRVRSLVPEIDRVSVTPFGVDTSAFRSDHRDEAAPRSGPLVVGTVKTMSETYGIDTLISAVAALRVRGHADLEAGRVMLRLAGDGPRLDEYRRLAASLGLEGVVEFLGPVPHARVPEVLAGFDVYAALSRRESFGVAAIEASACGLPVVVSDADGLREVVRDGETGLVVPRGDVEASAAAIGRLLLDSELRRRLGQAGRRWVESRFAWDRSVEIMIEVYQDVMSRSAR